MCREVDPSENHLKDMLQQLNSIIAAKPSEKAVVRQGECWLFMTVLHVSLSWIIYVLHTEM